MKRILSVTIAAGAALMLGTTAVSAQSITFGAGGGVTLPLGDFKDAAKTGWHGIGLVGYTMPSGLGVRGEFFYGQNTFKATSSVKGKLAGGLGSLTYDFKTAGGVKPYVLGSAGVFNVKATGPGGSASETKFSFGGGAGIKLRAGSDAHVFIESRYLSAQTSGGSTNFIPLTVGVSFGTK
jgi:hypothetical protein